MDMDSLLKEMRARGASDLHLVVGISPVIRIDGDIKMSGDKPLSAEKVKSLIYSLITAEKIAEFEKTHELDFSFGVNEVGRFRTNLHFQKGSMAVAIRHIPDNVPTLSELNLPAILAELALRRSGLILVTGPAGCGKSATQAAMVEIINEHRSAHIITLEDPIEYLHSHKKSVV